MRFSSRADARSRPKGFSTTNARALRVARSLQLLNHRPNKLGGIAR